MKKLQIILCFTAFAMVVFTGCKKDEDTVEIPEVFTESVSDVGENSVMASGSVANDGGAEIEERGFVLSTGPTPTIETGIIRLAGTGVGSYSSQITGLLGGTSYYLRAFATNAEGTGYGNAILFTTDELFGFNFQGSTIWGYPEDNMPWAVWGPQQIVGANNTANGQGNTQSIAIFDLPSGAKTCNSLEAFGHSNWYLPALDELVALYENQDLWGNFYNGLGIYWSSTEVSENEGYAVDFSTGEVSIREKNAQAGCRCVRRTF